MILRMGIDIAVRAPHQASLADERGELLWSGHRFRTNATDLDRLWERLPAGSEPSDITIVMEPTRNAWVPLAAWFRRRAAEVVLVSAERSADLRAYYAKHTKSDRLDSVLLARLPMLHPEGLHPERGIGPGDPLRRATKLPCSSAPTKPAASTPPWPPSTTGSWSRPANTTPPRSATSPPRCSPVWWPAGRTRPPTSSATSTAAPCPTPRRERSSPSGTRSPSTSAKPEPQRGRAGEARSHNVLHRPARPTPTLGDQQQLDIS